MDLIIKETNTDFDYYKALEEKVLVTIQMQVKKYEQLVNEKEKENSTLQIELINEKYHTRKQIEGYQQIQAMYLAHIIVRLEEKCLVLTNERAELAHNLERFQQIYLQNQTSNSLIVHV